MVKFHDSSFAHDYPFPTVTLAYFLRYPNPHATHVISTDVLDRHFDPLTQTLSTSRLHLKHSKLPSAVLKLLPRSWLNTDADGKSTKSYILERSVVDIRHGVMVTESRNLDFTSILQVAERQLYKRPSVDLGRWWLETWKPRKGYGLASAVVPARAGRTGGEAEDARVTEVHTKVELLSRLGESGKRLFGRGKTGDAGEEEEGPQPAKVGFFASLGRGPIQRSIEAVGLRRTERAVPNSQKGMNAVLERLRNGGLIGVLEGMRRDREMAFVGGASGLRSPKEEEKSSTDIF